MYEHFNQLFRQHQNKQAAKTKQAATLPFYLFLFLFFFLQLESGGCRHKRPDKGEWLKA